MHFSKGLLRKARDLRSLLLSLPVAHSPAGSLVSLAFPHTLGPHTLAWATQDGSTFVDDEEALVGRLGDDRNGGL